MSELTHVHWRFKEEASAAEQNLCDVPPAALSAEASIVFRPVLRQKPGFCECVRCVKIGRKLGILPSESRLTSDHSPLINRALTMITGCTCGWRTPLGTTDSDTAFSVHAATALAAEGRSA